MVHITRGRNPNPQNQARFERNRAHESGSMDASDPVSVYGDICIRPESILHF
jgi:hypothetical protein